MTHLYTMSATLRDLSHFALYMRGLHAHTPTNQHTHTHPRLHASKLAPTSHTMHTRNEGNERAGQLFTFLLARPISKN